MGPAFPAFLAPSGATPFDTDLAELGCQRPTAFALGENCVGRVSARAVCICLLAYSVIGFTGYANFPQATQVPCLALP